MLAVTMRVPGDRRIIEAAVEGLVRENAEIFRRVWVATGAPPPRLDRAGIVYRREHGTEDWQNAIDLWTVLSGDCEDLASYHAAWLRVVRREHARVRIVISERGQFHAIVQRADGRLTDPSRILIHL